MELIPASQQTLESGEFVLSESAKKLSEYESVRVHLRDVKKSIEVVAMWKTDKSKLVSETAQFDGRIDKLSVYSEGKRIVKGNTIAEVYAPVLSQLHRELLEAQKQQNETLIRSAVSRFRLPGFFDAFVEKLRSANQTFEQFPIIAQNPVL